MPSCCEIMSCSFHSNQKQSNIKTGIPYLISHEYTQWHILLPDRSKSQFLKLYCLFWISILYAVVTTIHQALGHDIKQAGGEGSTEDEMVVRHHQLDRHEFEQAPEVEGQGSLARCSPWGRKESDTTERLNWIESNLSANSTIPSIKKIKCWVPTRYRALWYYVL